MFAALMSLRCQLAQFKGGAVVKLGPTTSYCQLSHHRRSCYSVNSSLQMAGDFNLENPRLPKDLGLELAQNYYDWVQFTRVLRKRMNSTNTYRILFLCRRHRHQIQISWAISVLIRTASPARHFMPGKWAMQGTDGHINQPI